MRRPINRAQEGAEARAKVVISLLEGAAALLVPLIVCVRVQRPYWYHLKCVREDAEALLGSLTGRKRVQRPGLKL